MTESKRQVAASSRECGMTMCKHLFSGAKLGWEGVNNKSTTSATGHRNCTVTFENNCRQKSPHMRCDDTTKEVARSFHHFPVSSYTPTINFHPLHAVIAMESWARPSRLAHAAISQGSSARLWRLIPHSEAASANIYRSLDDWHDDLTVVRGHPHESGSTEHTFEACRQQVQELNRD